jgi:hypothetical protein
MVHAYRTIRRMRYGTSFRRLRHHDGGSPSSNTNSQESLRALAKRYGINQKTVAKWKQRETVADKSPDWKNHHRGSPSIGTSVKRQMKIRSRNATFDRKILEPVAGRTIKLNQRGKAGRPPAHPQTSST